MGNAFSCSLKQSIRAYFCLIGKKFQLSALCQVKAPVDVKFLFDIEQILELHPQNPSKKGFLGNFFEFYPQ